MLFLKVRRSKFLIVLCVMVLLFCSVYYPVSAEPVTMTATAIVLALLAMCGITFTATSLQNPSSDVVRAVDGFMTKYNTLVAEAMLLPIRASARTISVTAPLFMAFWDAAKAYFDTDSSGVGSCVLGNRAVINSYPVVGAIYPFGNVCLQLYEGTTGIIQASYVSDGSSPTGIIRCEYTLSGGVVSCVRYLKQTYLDNSPVLEGTWTYTQYVGTSTLNGRTYTDINPLTFGCGANSVFVTFPVCDQSIGVRAEDSNSFTVTSRNTGSFSLELGYDGLGNDVLPYNDVDKYGKTAVSDVIGSVGAVDVDYPDVGVCLPVYVPDTLPVSQADVLSSSAVGALEGTGSGTGGGGGGDEGETTPETINSFKAPLLILTKFPFCIPWDLYAAFAVLRADPVVPEFKLPFKMYDFEYEINISFARFQPLATVVRWFLLLLFIIGLILVTRNLIRG